MRQLDFPTTSNKQLRPYQERAVSELSNELTRVDSCMFQLATGGGKCLSAGTKILMYDATIKNVEDVVVGDILMGDDSTPRTVLSTTSGEEMMYEVIPVKGDPYTVNESHILSLRMTGVKSVCGYNPGEVVNISVSEYLLKNDTFKHCAKGYRVPIDFDGQGDELLMEPYYLGIWLGDGHSDRNAVTSADQPVIDYLYDYANRNGLKIRVESQKSNCAIYHLKDAGSGRVSRWRKVFAHKYDLFKNKHIPIEYLRASREVRLELLAGLIDSDGHYDGKAIDYVCVNEKLIDGIIFLVRSLGLACYKKQVNKTCYNNGVVGLYYRISISGNLEIIPSKKWKITLRGQRKNVLNVGIRVREVGIGKYYGFEIDGNRLFVLGDFTVTHNTVVLSAIAQRFNSKSNKPVVIIVHRSELLAQTRKTLYDWYGIVVQPIDANTPTIAPSQVYVAMVETLARRISKPYFSSLMKDAGLVIIDEAHIGNFEKLFKHFPSALRVGFSATPISAVKSNPLKNHYKSIVCGVDIPELIEQGSLVQNYTVSPEGNLDRSELKVTNGKFDDEQQGSLLKKAKPVNNTVEKYIEFAFGKKAVIFNANVSHSLVVTEAFIAANLPCKHLDGETPDAERRAIFEWFKNTDGAILCNVGVATTGFDEPSIECVIVNKATLQVTLWLQMCGRGARPFTFPGGRVKDHFIIIDMGGNAATLGDWNWARDWKMLFMHPPKPKDGVAPIKSCPKCDAMVPASARFCTGITIGLFGPLRCGYEFPLSSTIEVQEFPITLKLITKGVDMAKMVNSQTFQNASGWTIMKQMAMDVTRLSAEQWVGDGVPTEADAELITLECYGKVKELRALIGEVKLNAWAKNTIKRLVREGLKSQFPDFIYEPLPSTSAQVA